MRNCYDGMIRKILTDDTLHYILSLAVDAIGKQVVSTVSRRMNVAGFAFDFPYLLVASSRIRIVLGRNIARARQNSCFWPCERKSSSISVSKSPFS